MAGGIGWEHRQIQSLTAIFNRDHIHRIGTGEGIVEHPGPKSKSTNQNFLAIAVALGSNSYLLRLAKVTAQQQAAERQAINFYSTMLISGHQSDIPDPTHINPPLDGYRIEGPLCPRVHGDIHMWARAMMLWLVSQLSITGELLELVLNEWADHIALCAFFWTVVGIRAPGSRALIGAGRPHPFDWSWWYDNYAYSAITGIGRGLTSRVARLDQPLANVIIACDKWFPEINRRAQIAKPHLAIGCQKWITADGSGIAALDHDMAMNQRLSGIQWNEKGDIVDAWNNRSKVIVPNMGNAGDIVMSKIGY